MRQDGMLGLDVIGSRCLDNKITAGVCCVDQSWCTGGVVCGGYELPGGQAGVTCV